MAELVIRKMNIIDIDEVMEVEKASFTEPWPKEIFAQEVLKNDYAYYFIAQLNNKVIGYAGMWVVIDDAQITNIAIIPQYRGLKIGEKLFEYVRSEERRVGKEGTYPYGG